MPTVPRSPLADNVIPFKPQLPEPWALMAAAQMHSEGRLIEPNSPLQQIPITPANSFPGNDDMVAGDQDRANRLTRDRNEYPETTSRGTFITDPSNRDHEKL